MTIADMSRQEVLDLSRETTLYEWTAQKAMQPMVVERAKGIYFWDADGKRYLVIHGDEFDVVVRYARWLAFLGDRGYELALWMNHPLNFIRRRFGLGYWSLSAHLKLRVKTAVNFIGEFEKSLSDEARRNEVDGVICGHIHHAASREMDGVHYLNCGDWVESCTAIAEDHNGTLRVLRWRDMEPAATHAVTARPKPVRVAA